MSEARSFVHVRSRCRCSLAHSLRIALELSIRLVQTGCQRTVGCLKLKWEQHRIADSNFSCGTAIKHLRSLRCQELSMNVDCLEDAMPILWSAELISLRLFAYLLRECRSAMGPKRKLPLLQPYRNLGILQRVSLHSTALQTTSRMQ